MSGVAVSGLGAAREKDGAALADGENGQRPPWEDGAVAAEAGGAAEGSPKERDEGGKGAQERRARMRFLPHQVAILERSFRECEALNVHKATHLAKVVGVEVRQVYVWYQNRRARRRRKDLDVDVQDWPMQCVKRGRCRIAGVCDDDSHSCHDSCHDSPLQYQAKALLASLAQRCPADVEDPEESWKISRDLKALLGALNTLHKFPEAMPQPNASAPPQPCPGEPGGASTCPQQLVASLATGAAMLDADAELPKPDVASPADSRLDLELRLEPAAALDEGPRASGHDDVTPCSLELSHMLPNLSEDTCSSIAPHLRYPRKRHFERYPSSSPVPYPDSPDPYHLGPPDIAWPGQVRMPVMKQERWT